MKRQADGYCDLPSVSLLSFMVYGIFIIFPLFVETKGPREADGVAKFIDNLMLYLLEHVDSKDKQVRTRICQIMVACVNGIDELSDALWSLFRSKMVERLFDKEPTVRVQAVHSTARLQVTK